MPARRLDELQEGRLPALGLPLHRRRLRTPYTHPDYDPSRFWVYDLGVVVLDEPWALQDGHEYASLPEPGQFDSWTSSTKQVFTAVGYGLQEAYGAGANKDVGGQDPDVLHPRAVLGEHALDR